MTPEQRRAALAYRKLVGRPLHAPPHFSDGVLTYFLSAANYQHAPIMCNEGRRTEFERKLLKSVSAGAGAEVLAWCVLPTHWHLLARLDLAPFSEVIGRLHNGTATQWNREDGTPGRKVWHRFADRRIRGDAHYWATVNYIHANPVRHRCVRDGSAWPTSSVHLYMEELGRDEMLRLWQAYPVADYGRGWDW